LNEFLCESDDLAGLNSNVLDISTVYHNLLFSYQRSLKTYLGSRAGVYVHPTIDHLLRMEEQGGLKLVNSETLEEALKAFADYLVKGGMVGACSVESIGEDRYVFRVEKCIFAPKVHSQVNVEDVTCPYGLVAMALYKKFKGQIANERESEYHANGTETILEPASL
jgi:hypothetical protein